MKLRRTESNIMRDISDDDFAILETGSDFRHKNIATLKSCITFPTFRSSPDLMCQHGRSDLAYSRHSDKRDFHLRFIDRSTRYWRVNLSDFPKRNPFAFRHPAFHFPLLSFAVLPDAVRIAVISLASASRGSMRSFGISSAAVMSSSQ